MLKIWNITKQLWVLVNQIVKNGLQLLMQIDVNMLEFSFPCNGLEMPMIVARKIPMETNLDPPNSEMFESPKKKESLNIVTEVEYQSKKLII